MTSHLLPKNMGVLPSAAELAGCLTTSYANTSVKKEAVHPGTCAGMCAPCERVLWGSMKGWLRVPHTCQIHLPLFLVYERCYLSLGTPFKGLLPLEHGMGHL